jgi:endoglucanase
MYRTILFLMIFVNLFYACDRPEPKGYLRVSGTQIVDGQGDTILLRGMGLGGWMLQEGYMFRLGFLGQQYRIKEEIEKLVGKEKTDQFYEQWLQHHTTQADIDSMASWGFNSIRLPMHYQLYTLSVENESIAGQQTWLEEGFRYTDSLLSWCSQAGIYLILDLHAAPGGQGHDLAISDRNPTLPSFWESDANQQKAIALWQKLAERYAEEPWIGGYDLINEPNWGFEDPEDRLGVREKLNQPLRTFLMEATKAIRQVDTNHIIFIEGNGFGNNYEGIFPLWDDQIVVSFHKYGNPNTQAAIQSFLDIRQKHQVPIWLGESGENSNTWFTEAIALCEENQIGWAWWQNKKMGINQPLEIMEPIGYRRLIDYWNQKGEKPQADEVANILDQWIEQLKIENNIIHWDVLDALFRQINSKSPIPFPNARDLATGTLVQAVDFDMGKQRIAYVDMDTASYRFTPGVHTQGNRGNRYRNDGVDIGQDAEGYHIDHIEDGEWWLYTRTITQSDLKNMHLYYHSPEEEGQIQVLIDQQPVTAIIHLPITDPNETWHRIDIPLSRLDEGKRTIQIKAIKGGFNFKSFSFTKKQSN